MRHKRLRKLIKPSLQLRLIGGFAIISIIALVLQAILLTSRVTAFASQLPTGGSVVVEEVPSLVLGALGTSFLFLLPLILVVGVLSTFRIAGPVYRFEQHMRALARGEDPGSCRIREGDELGELCAAINAAVEALREERREGGSTLPEQANCAPRPGGVPGVLPTHARGVQRPDRGLSPDESSTSDHLTP